MPVRRIAIPLKSEVPSLNNISQIGGDVLYEPLRFDPLDRVHLIWMKDVMPSMQGFTSMIKRAFVTTPIATTYTPSYPYRVDHVYDDSDETAYYFRTPGPDVFIKDDGTAVNGGTSGGTDVYTFNTFRGEKGQVYFNSSRLAVKYDIATNAFSTLTSTGITMAGITGVCTALNYMIAWDGDTIYWSAPGSAGQFNEEVAGVATGAGLSQLTELTGTIIVCYPIANGFMIYGTDNVISATYSQNFDFPWVFREVDGSAGIDLHDKVAYTGALGTHYAWTKKGILEINNAEANQLFQDVTAFLSGSVFYNSDGDGTYSKSTSQYHDGSYNVPLPLHTKVALVSGRFFCISYGEYEAKYEYVLIYDIYLKQWGKIKVDHLDVFEYIDLANTVYVPGTSKLDQVPCNIGILKDDGTMDVYRSFFETGITGQAPSSTSNGEVTIGDIKFSAGHNCALNMIQIEGEIDSSNFNVYVKTKFEGGTESAEVEFSASTTDPKMFLGDVTGKSHRIRITGAFNISEIKVDIANTSVSK